MPAEAAVAVAVKAKTPTVLTLTGSKVGKVVPAVTAAEAKVIITGDKAAVVVAKVRQQDLKYLPVLSADQVVAVVTTVTQAVVVTVVLVHMSTIQISNSQIT